MNPIKSVPREFFRPSDTLWGVAALLIVMVILNTIGRDTLLAGSGYGALEFLASVNFVISILAYIISVRYAARLYRARGQFKWLRAFQKWLWPASRRRRFLPYMLWAISAALVAVIIFAWLINALKDQNVLDIYYASTRAVVLMLLVAWLIVFFHGGRQTDSNNQTNPPAGTPPGEAASGKAPDASGKTEDASASQPPISQGTAEYTDRTPQWVKLLPFLDESSIKIDQSFKLVDVRGLSDITGYHTHPAREVIEKDVKFLDEVVLQRFRQFDAEAKLYQNKYRRYQITYMLLAALATLLGSILALAFDKNSTVVYLAGFGETAIALITTYFATTVDTKDLLEKYLLKRQRAEALRREYFRYIANLVPYNTSSDAERQRILRSRVSSIAWAGRADAPEPAMETTNSKSTGGNDVAAQSAG